jgi:hypothetical protein
VKSSSFLGLVNTSAALSTAKQAKNHKKNTMAAWMPNSTCGAMETPPAAAANGVSVARLAIVVGMFHPLGCVQIFMPVSRRNLAPLFVMAINLLLFYVVKFVFKSTRIFVLVLLLELLVVLCEEFRIWRPKCQEQNSFPLVGCAFPWWA